MILGSDTITFAGRIIKYPAPHSNQYPTKTQEIFIVGQHPHKFIYQFKAQDFFRNIIILCKGSGNFYSGKAALDFVSDAYSTYARRTKSKTTPPE